MPNSIADNMRQNHRALKSSHKQHILSLLLKQIIYGAILVFVMFRYSKGFVGAAVKGRKWKVWGWWRGEGFLSIRK